MSVSLTLNHVNKTFIKDGEEFHAVQNVNLSVNTGEFLTFLGPSGCGKTTTLRMVAGFEVPASGQILMGDETSPMFRPTSATSASSFRTTRCSRT